MTVRVEPSLKEFARDLRKIDKELPKEIRRTNKAAADLVSNDSRAIAGTGTKAQRQAAKTIRPRAETTRALIEIRPTKRAPYALAAFLGMKGRSGWYARSRYRRSTGRQHLPWVGNQYELGKGKGPYAIGPAFNKNNEKIVELYEELTDRLANQLAGFSGEG